MAMALEDELHGDLQYCANTCQVFLDSHAYDQSSFLAPCQGKTCQFLPCTQTNKSCQGHACLHVRGLKIYKVSNGTVLF